MANIIVAGLGENQSIHLVRSRKAEGSLRNGEYVHKDKSGKVIGYRKDLPKKDNWQPKALTGLSINRLMIKEWDNPKGKSWTYSVVVTSQTGSHRIDIGSGMLGTSVANTLLSLTKHTAEELAEMKFSISFYCNAKGYNTAYITHSNGEALDWFMSPDEQKSYIRSAPNSLDPSKIDTDRSGLHKHLMMMADELNKLLPRSSMDQGSALDGIDDDEDTVASATPSDAEELFADPVEPEEITLVKQPVATTPTNTAGPAGSFEV